MRRLRVRLQDWIARWTLKRLARGLKLSDPALTPNQQIEALQRQIAALKALQVANPTVSLADQLAAIPQPSLVTPSLVAQIAANGALSPTVAQPVSAQDIQQGAQADAAVQPVVAPVASVPEPVAAPVVTPNPDPAAQPEPVPAMETQTPQSATAPATAEQAATPPSTGSSLPDVKMLAPILKIALATLSIEQMVEIGLHVKMGAPGFKQFLDSDIAKTKFRELYATYCDFLAGKVK